MVEWPRGEARDCKSLYTGSNPVSTSNVFCEFFICKFMSCFKNIRHEFIYLVFE
jgi:hypothetical protein